MPLTAIALNCTLKSGDAPSSTDRMLGLILKALREHDVRGEIVRIADHNVKPGVTSDEGEGDAWPELRKRVLAADILVMGSPIWLGQPSSVAKRVLERMDAFFDEGDESGRLPSYGRVAIVAVVGNEDGAHHVSAELFQALNDVGFTLAPNAVAYWVGEAMGDVDFQDLKKVPDVVQSMIDVAAENTAHLAGLLKGKPFPRPK